LKKAFESSYHGFSFRKTRYLFVLISVAISTSRGLEGWIDKFDAHAGFFAPFALINVDVAPKALKNITFT